MMLASLVFGMAAWCLAVAVGVKTEKSLSYMMGSFTACCLSALCAFLEIYRRVRGGDIGGLIDTIDVTIVGVIVMLAVMVLLNLTAWIVWKRSV